MLVEFFFKCPHRRTSRNERSERETKAELFEVFRACHLIRRSRGEAESVEAKL